MPKTFDSNGFTYLDGRLHSFGGMPACVEDSRHAILQESYTGNITFVWYDNGVAQYTETLYAQVIPDEEKKYDPQSKITAVEAYECFVRITLARRSGNINNTNQVKLRINDSVNVCLEPTENDQDQIVS